MVFVAAYIVQHLFPVFKSIPVLHLHFRVLAGVGEEALDAGVG